jgi:hypothetical protein
MAVAGANIANAAGRPDKDSPYNPWTSAVIQFPLGPYVEGNSETQHAADTNYIGYNSHVKYGTNVLGQGSVAVGPTIAPQPNWVVPNNDNDVRGGTGQWVRAAGTIAANGTCTVTAGAATAGAGTYECNVPGGVVAGDFFWANVTADT